MADPLLASGESLIPAIDPQLRPQYIDGMLLGRERECARLDALVSQVRAGASAALIVEGEAGIGKTSLLAHAAAHASGLRILRARGVESEQNLPFAGLADLAGPILGYLDALPGPQRSALAGALAVGPVTRADRFAICAATFSLLSAAAATRPVLAVVDDAHWLDAASAQAVGFSARRLGQEAIGLVVAVRLSTASSFDAARMDTMAVAGLDQAAARELLASNGRSIATPVAERLVSEMGGNPLALLELSATLTDAELSGLTSLPEPLPVAAALRHAFAQRLDAINPASRRLLVLAACDATADLATLQRAGRLLSLDLTDLTAAEEAGLVRVEDGRIEFTHPLLRSAAYHTAEPSERRAAHRALADGTDPGRDPIRKAWHLAAATVGPDESVAASLDLAAKASGARNAFITASRTHQRAAELTEDPGRQVSRWMAAGHAAHLGGDLASAARLLSRAIDLAADPCTKADAQLMLAHAAMYTERPLGQHHELVSEADAVLPFDQLRAATLLALASGLCIMIGRLGLALETARRAARLVRGSGGIAWLLSQASLAPATILTGNRAAGRQLIAGILAHPDLTGHDPAIELLRIRCGQSLVWCEDHQSAESLLKSSVNAGRAQGRVADLPYGLAILSELHFRTGDWTQAYADATEAVELGTDYTTRTDLGYALVCAGRIDAAMGTAAQCRARLAQAVSLAKRTGVVSITAYAVAARGLLELGGANYGQAAADLARAAALIARHGVLDPCVIQWRPDFIESLIRLGRIADARDQLAVLDAEAASVGSQWARATAARCRGLLQDSPQQAIAHLEEAVAVAETSASIFEQARARMCLGEALRRARQRGEARRQLGLARSAFELLGAQPWADRTAAELATVGVRAAPRRTPIHVRLTPQELRVALQVAEGLSNQEVAARLFLSHKTIEVHLGHIYDKLGVRSRTGLARLVHSGAVQQ
jgi:DNA-binding NarL/FixJ family response regulator